MPETVSPPSAVSLGSGSYGGGICHQPTLWRAQPWTTSNARANMTARVSARSPLRPSRSVSACLFESKSFCKPLAGLPQMFCSDAPRTARQVVRSCCSSSPPQHPLPSAINLFLLLIGPKGLFGPRGPFPAFAVCTTVGGRRTEAILTLPRAARDAACSVRS